MADPVGAAFDELVAELDPAMVVVTAAADGEDRGGCLVGFHAQVSLTTRRYVVWVSRNNRTYRIAQRSTHLAVHALRDDDHELAELFGGATGDEVDKLAMIDWVPGPGGAPLITALPVRFAGRVVTELDLPDTDHVGFVLEPVTGDSGPDGASPLRLHDATDIDPGHPA